MTSSRITHATPAALYAHSPNRGWEANTNVPDDKTDCEDIARQLIYSEVGRKVNVTKSFLLNLYIYRKMFFKLNKKNIAGDFWWRHKEF